ncbi:MAG: 3-deoxy-8-phosphooctulonate synthase [Alphaproteobacteria bacterium]|jgi:2-dehydro-3-deoxyphosphooctonate aldolase (KDO 8-P synthase)|nr:3-deoxy-8-phosphooctulonate synthase [Alphaproteobacteria bacterium]
MELNKVVKVSNYNIANNLPFTLMAGPCVLESKEHAMFMCGELVKITKNLGINLIYKSSYDKANRTSINAKRGLGLKESLKIFQDIKDKFNIPVITDIHEPHQCAEVAEVVDVLQIPAFLCRQTDLLLSAGKTGKTINVKKGQFLAPWDMKNIVSKIESTGNKNILLCERGASFGYNNLVVDMTGLPIMAETGYPVIFDATHSVQKPGGGGDKTSGNREYAPVLAKAALATGIAGIFMEVHQDPDNAPSDGPNMIELSKAEQILSEFLKFDNLAKSLM